MARTFAIGDIHGCCRTFEALLQKIGYSRSDRLFLLGDYIDRGPDSRGVVERLLSLRSDGYQIRPILGNHEDLLLKCIDSGNEEDLLTWLDNGGDATLKSYRVKRPADIDGSHVDFMRGLPRYRMTRTHVFVHAGLDLTQGRPLSLRGRESMLWDRSGDSEPAKIGGRTLVSGHTIMELDEILESVSSDHIRIDNGCFTKGCYSGTGSLVILELSTNCLTVQEYIG